MADDRAFRVHLQYLPEEQVFVARVVELDLLCKAESRAEALEKIEAEIEATVERLAVDGSKVPRPTDTSIEPASIQLDLAAPIWRDLNFHARAQKLEPTALALQLLTRALGQLDGRGPSKKVPKEPPTEVKTEAAKEGEAAEGEKRDGRRNNRRGRGRGGGRREGYRPDMEDQANFLAYVRDQEKGGRGRR